MTETYSKITHTVHNVPRYIVYICHIYCRAVINKQADWLSSWTKVTRLCKVASKYHRWPPGRYTTYSQSLLTTSSVRTYICSHDGNSRGYTKGLPRQSGKVCKSSTRYHYFLLSRSRKPFLYSVELSSLRLIMSEGR